jgi:hypothetical protein
MGNAGRVKNCSRLLIGTPGQVATISSSLPPQRTAPRLHSKQDIEASIEIEVAEVNISTGLEILMNEGERRSCANIGRPSAALSGPRKPVNTFEVQRDKVGYFSKCKLSVRTKKERELKIGPIWECTPNMNSSGSRFGIRPGHHRDRPARRKSVVSGVTLQVVELREVLAAYLLYYRHSDR